MKTQRLEEKRKILLNDFKTLVLVDYCYECDSTSYFYKIYKFINEYGEPMRWPVIGAHYNEFTGEEIKTVVGHRQYKRSYRDYTTYDEALEAGIMEATIMATLLTTILPDKPDIYGRVYSEEVKKQIIEYLNDTRNIKYGEISHNIRKEIGEEKFDEIERVNEFISKQILKDENEKVPTEEN